MEAQRRRRARKFLSTLSLRRATKLAFDGIYSDSISIHALLAESDMPFATVYAVIVISIHALLAESDHGHCAFGHAVDISIHALLAESDKRPKPPTCRSRYFYPRSPCGERPGTIGAAAGTAAISIHALLAESDR